MYLPAVVVAWEILTENAIALSDPLNSHIETSHRVKNIYYFKGTFLHLILLLMDITGLHYAYITYLHEMTCNCIIQNGTQIVPLPHLYFFRYAGHLFTEARRVPFPLMLFVCSFLAICISHV